MRAEARGGGAWEAILCPLTLVGVVLAAYRPLLDHDGGWGLAQEWDDRNNFLENDLVRRPLSRETLRGMWSARRINVFEPLGWLDRRTRRFTSRTPLRRRVLKSFSTSRREIMRLRGVWTYRRINWTTSTSKITFPSTIPIDRCIVLMDALRLGLVTAS